MQKHRLPSIGIRMVGINNPYCFLFALILLVTVIVVFLSKSAYLRNVNPSNNREYKSVISALKDGTLKFSSVQYTNLNSTLIKSSLLLPNTWAKASIDGEIYVNVQSNNDKFIIFKTWRGKGFNMKGYLYSSRINCDNLFSTNDNGQKEIVIDSIEFLIDNKYDSQWYSISRNLD